MDQSISTWDQTSVCATIAQTQRSQIWLLQSCFQPMRSPLKMSLTCTCCVDFPHANCIHTAGFVCPLNEFLEQKIYLGFWFISTWRFQTLLRRKKKNKTKKRFDFLFLTEEFGLGIKDRSGFSRTNRKPFLMIFKIKAKPHPKFFYWKKVIAIFIFHTNAWVKCPLLPQPVAKTELQTELF